MRLKLYKTIGLFVVLINVIVVYYVWRIFVTFHVSVDLNVKEPISKPITKHLSKLITVVLRDFELYENDVSATARSFANALPNVQILVLCTSPPYPPLELIQAPNISYKNIKVIDLKENLNISYVNHYFLNHVRTKYVLFVPDSTRLPNKQILQFITSEMLREMNTILAIPVSGIDLNCFKIRYNLRQWILNYNIVKDTVCHAVEGKHLIVIETSILTRLPNVELIPFPLSLYLQTSFLNYSVSILNSYSN